ncbi:hypothetical protein DsansV1_C10g0103051 [Dioscorea sansibarensis]
MITRTQVGNTEFQILELNSILKCIYSEKLKSTPREHVSRNLYQIWSQEHMLGKQMIQIFQLESMLA